jgi:hypothetical protein
MIEPGKNRFLVIPSTKFIYGNTHSCFFGKVHAIAVIVSRKRAGCLIVPIKPDCRLIATTKKYLPITKFFGILFQAQRDQCSQMSITGILKEASDLMLSPRSDLYPLARCLSERYLETDVIALTFIGERTTEFRATVVAQSRPVPIVIREHKNNRHGMVVGRTKSRGAHDPSSSPAMNNSFTVQVVESGSDGVLRAPGLTDQSLNRRKIFAASVPGVGNARFKLLNRIPYRR